MRLDPPPAGKVATTIEHEGQRVAAIVHAAELEERRELVRTVGAAAAMTLRNERLDAELRAKVTELQASRSRIVQAGYDTVSGGKKCVTSVMCRSLHSVSLSESSCPIS